MSIPDNSDPKRSGPISKPLVRTQQVLSGLRDRLRRQILLHGIGTIVLAFAGVLALAFALDRFLHVPRIVRLLFLGALIAVPVWLALRELVAHLRNLPDRAGLALLVERHHPELHEVLSTAIELEGNPDVDPAISLRIAEEAERRADQVAIERVLDVRGPKRRAVAGFAGAALCTLLFALNADTMSIFWARLFGRNVSWPRATTLVIEIPLPEERALQDEMESADGKVRTVRVARGTDVPILVRAIGEVPSAVTLRFASGHSTALAPSPSAGVFRTLLRSVQTDLSFYATGGDDRDQEPRINVLCLQPPDVSGLAVEVTPPAYSGLGTRVSYDGDVEVLEGSTVRVTVRPDPPEATGLARLFPEDRTLELQRSPWPESSESAGSEAGATPDTSAGSSNEGQALSFEVQPAETLRYRFELTDETGLENPDPGLFAIHVREDKKPTVEILAPGRAEVETVVGGVLPLRVRAGDDFGIESLQWTSTAADAEPATYDLNFAPISPSNGEATSGVAVLSAARLTGELLAGAIPSAEGQQFQLTVSANDNRLPDAQRGESVELRVRVVSADEFMRRLQDRLARARLSAGELTDLQRDKWTRTRELLAALDSDEIEFGPDSAGIAGALTGQRRVLGDAGALTRELASITESLIYSSIDDRSGSLLEALDTSLAQHPDKSFHVESWRSLAEIAQRDPSVASGLAGRLVLVIQLSLEVSEESGTRAAEELANAQDSGGELEEARRALTAASQAQERSLQKLEELIERLAEWDNFQSVLALTRDILNRQKNLLERTKSFAKEQ